jgi:hypothetical protein
MDEIRSTGNLTTAPPPPTEVKIRTMKSDIAMMASSGGGGLPQFESVHVVGLSPQRESEQDAATGAVRAESKSNLLLIVLLAIALIALAVVGWFVYVKFKG